MKKLVLLIMTGMLTVNVFAVFQTAAGYGSQQLYTTAGSGEVLGGLAMDSAQLYFGQNTRLKSISTQQPYGIQGDWLLDSASTGVSYVMRQNGTTYVSYTTGYFPNPVNNQVGYLNGSGQYVDQFQMDGIWDAAVNSNGSCYLVANPGSTGTCIYEYGLTTGNMTEVAAVGGYSGGITFDQSGNLYYADQVNGHIIRYSAQQLAAGGLVYADAEVVYESLFAGYIGFDAGETFYATTGYGGLFASYDLEADAKITDIATGGIGNFVFGQDQIYLLDTDWNAYASTIQEVSVVPEPMTLALLASGVVLSRIRKKRC